MAKIRYQGTSTGADADTIVASPATDRKVVVDYLVVSTDGACIVTFEEDKAAGDVKVLVLDFAAAGAVVLPGPHVLHTEELGADLLVTNSAANISVTCLWRESAFGL